MATPQARDTLASRMKVLMYDDDSATSATLHYTSWQAMEDYENVMICVMFAAGTGMAATSGIYIASDSDASDVALIKAFSNPTTVDAVGDWRYAEISAEQIAQEGADAGVVYTHVSAGICADDNADEYAVVYILVPGRFKYDGLTADVTA